MGLAKSYGVTYNGLPIIRMSYSTAAVTPSYPVALNVAVRTTTTFTPSAYSSVDSDPAAFWAENSVDYNWCSLGTVSF
jgi:hypothetical protein